MYPLRHITTHVVQSAMGGKLPTGAETIGRCSRSNTAVTSAGYTATLVTTSVGKLVTPRKTPQLVALNASSEGPFCLARQPIAGAGG